MLAPFFYLWEPFVTKRFSFPSIQVNCRILAIFIVFATDNGRTQLVFGRYFCHCQITFTMPPATQKFWKFVIQQENLLYLNKDSNVLGQLSHSIDVLTVHDYDYKIRTNCHVFSMDWAHTCPISKSHVVHILSVDSVLFSFT